MGNTLLRLSLAVCAIVSTTATPIQTNILITSASSYDRVINGPGVEVIANLYEEGRVSSNTYFNAYAKLMSQLEEAALELCANVVMEFSTPYYSSSSYTYTIIGTGVAVCDPNLGPCC